MREIKFRAYDKNDGMFYNIQNGIEFSDLSHYTFRDFLGNSDAIGDYHKWEIMQFTGLKDKNGKEIYERDIVKEVKNPYDNITDIGIVVYKENIACFVIESERFGYCMLNEGNTKRDGKLKYSEVIGNIYENKNLLNN